MSEKRSVTVQYRRSIKSLRRAQKATQGSVGYEFIRAEKFAQKQESYR